MRKKRFYVRYDLVYNCAKIGWGEIVKAVSRLEAKHFIEDKHKDNHIKVISIHEM